MKKWILSFVMAVASFAGAQAQTAISQVYVSASTATTATINWTTSTPTTSQVLYGTDNTLPYSNSVDRTLKTSHSMQLILLSTQYLYYFAVVSVDGSNHSAQSSTYNFALCGQPFGPLTGTVNNYYEYGTFTATWVPPAGVSGTPTVCGQTMPTTVTGSLSGGASLSASLADSYKAIPGPGTWQITVRDVGNLSPITTTYPVSAQNTDVSLPLQALAPAASLTAVISNTTSHAIYPGYVCTTYNNLCSSGGTVTSVGLSLPTSVFSVSGSPVTGTGTLTGTFTTQTQNTIFAAPCTGGPGVPTFRAPCSGDGFVLELPSGAQTVFQPGSTNLSINNLAICPQSTPYTACTLGAYAPSASSPSQLIAITAAGTTITSPAGFLNFKSASGSGFQFNVGSSQVLSADSFGQLTAKASSNDWVSLIVLSGPAGSATTPAIFAVCSLDLSCDTSHAFDLSVDLLGNTHMSAASTAGGAQVCTNLNPCNAVGANTITAWIEHLNAMTNVRKAKSPFTVTALPVDANQVAIEGGNSSTNESIIFSSPWVTEECDPAFIVANACVAIGETRKISFEANTTADWFDFRFYGNAAGYQVLIDGVATADYYTYVANNGNNNSFRVDLDGKPHRIKLRGSGGAAFSYIISPNGAADFSAPTTPIGPTVDAFGDSFMEPTITGTWQAGSVGQDGFIEETCRLLQWNCHNYALGGTGYIANDGGTRDTIGQAVTAVNTATSATPANIAIFAAGINDGTYSTSSIVAAAIAAWQSWLTAHPAGIVLVMGPWYTNGNPSNPADTVALDAALEAAAKSQGPNVYWVASPVQEGWYPANPSYCPPTGTTATYSQLNCVVQGPGNPPHPTTYQDRLFGQNLATDIILNVQGLTGWIDEAVPFTSATGNPAHHGYPESSGTWTFTNGSAAITGSGTAALSQFYPGEVVRATTLSSSSPSGTIQSCASNTACTLTANYGGTSGTSPVVNTMIPVTAQAQPNGNILQTLGNLAGVSDQTRPAGCLTRSTPGGVASFTTCATPASNPIFTGNITLTTATSDALTLTGVTTSSKCSFSPTNATAAGLTSTTLAGYYTVTANTFTLNHAATTASGATFGVICTTN